jgi:adenylate cyclase
VKNLEAEIQQKTRELALIKAIDQMRDAFREDEPPAAIYDRLLAFVTREIGADASFGLIHHLGEDTLDSVLAVGLDLNTANNLSSLIAGSSGPVTVTGWPHATRLLLKTPTDDLLGGFVLCRSDEANPFTDEENQLLAVAGDHIDSAILQAQRIWRLARRNRELDTIFRLDELRDSKPNEKDLVNGFIQLIQDQYNSSFCAVFLSDPDTEKMTARGVIDRHGLSTSHHESILGALETLSSVEAIPSPIEGLNLLAAPFVIHDTTVGAVVIGRRAEFSREDHRLMTAMSSQMDSAIVYSRVIDQLSQRNRELEIIYHIDQIRDREIDFDAMLQAVLGELCGAIDAEMGYILLYNEEEEDQLEIKSSTDNGILPSPAYYEAIHTISRRALDHGKMLIEQPGGQDVRSAIAVPLILRERVIGVFGGINSGNPRGFGSEDQRMLNAIVSQTDTAVFERLEQRQVRQVLGRSVDPKVLEKMLDSGQPANLLSRERMHVSVVFADLRGSTEWAEVTPPDDLAHMLNLYLGRMTDVIFEYGGTLDKFVGDEVIGLFGAPLPLEDHALLCAQAALKMQKVMADLREEMRVAGFHMPQMGVGVSTGEAVCGEFGTSQRTDYTAMGRMMNLGARLCSAAGGGEVMISEATQQVIGPQSKSILMDGFNAKGIGKVPAYKLIEIQEGT